MSLGEALDIHNLPSNSSEAQNLADKLEEDQKVCAKMEDGVYSYYSTSATVFRLDFNNGMASMAIPRERAQSGRHAYEVTRNWCDKNMWVCADFDPPVPDQKTIDEAFFDRLQDQLVEAHKAKALFGR